MNPDEDLFLFWSYPILRPKTSQIPNKNFFLVFAYLISGNFNSSYILTKFRCEALAVTITVTIVTFLVAVTLSLFHSKKFKDIYHLHSKLDDPICLWHII